MNSCKVAEEKNKSSRTQTQLNVDLEHLTKKESEQEREFLQRNQHVFAEPGKPLGRTDLVHHRINTGDA